MARVVVVGGGMAGLATALFSARRGHEVTVVDRDPGPPPGGVEAASAWERRGVAQAQFAHGWPARSAWVLRREAPELLAELHAAGIGTTDARFGPGFEDDRVLTARRPVYEAVLREFVACEPGVALVHGSVVGLASSPSGGRVVGVKLADTTTIDADLVVDAGGRRSASGRWLRSLGFDEPTVEDHSCGLHYLSRHYRLRDGEELPVNDMVFEPLPYLNVFTFVGDNRTFAVALAVSSSDPLRANLQDPDVYERLLQAMPVMSTWVSRAEPISDVYVMAGLSNRRQRLVEDGRVAAPGLVQVGDAALYTNPTLGQGVSLGFWMAHVLADLVERAPKDPAEVAVEYDRWIDDELGSRFRRQVQADQGMRRQLEAGVEGASFLAPDDAAGQYLAALGRLAGRDPEIGNLLGLVANLLLPRSAYEAPEVRAAVAAILEERAPTPPEIAITRSAFEALVGS